MQTGYWLNLAARAVSRDFARWMASEDVTVTECDFLLTLYQVGTTAPSVLADRMHVDSGTVTKLSDRLIDKGWLLRTGNSTDRRAYQLSLTPAGQASNPDGICHQILRFSLQRIIARRT